MKKMDARDKLKVKNDQAGLLQTIRDKILHFYGQNPNPKSLDFLFLHWNECYLGYNNLSLCARYVINLLPSCFAPWPSSPVLLRRLLAKSHPHILNTHA